jgi:hypothetical protein
MGLDSNVYKGLTPQARGLVDSAAGGSIMSKTLDEAFELIEYVRLGQVKELYHLLDSPGKDQLNSNGSITIKVDILSLKMKKYHVYWN